MRRLMEYKIIAGKTVEIRRAWIDMGARYQPPKRRGLRVKGKTSLKKLQANEQEAIRQLARLINCNFGQGDMWITLRYDDETLAAMPADQEERQEAGKAFLRRFLRKYGDRCRKEGRKLRYISTTSVKAASSQEPARLHHHIIMERMDYERLCELWPCGAAYISYRIMDGRGDYTGIARYMCANAGEPRGKKRWSCSQGLNKPVYTEPVPVHDLDIKVPRNGWVEENWVQYSAESGTGSAYLRYVRLPKQPKRRRE